MSISHHIIEGWYNRPNSARHIKWTQSHPTPRNCQYEIHAAVALEIPVFWTVTPCSQVVYYQLIRESCCLHLQGRRVNQMGKCGQRYGECRTRTGAKSKQMATSVDRKKLRAFSANPCPSFKHSVLFYPEDGSRSLL
jgi:hypothetical protein